MKRRLQAVLWDMDGTLMEPNGSIRSALNGAVTWAGFAPFADDDVLVGMPLRDILAIRSDDLPTIEAMVDEFRRISHEESWRMVRWHDGVKATVETLRDAGVKQAVVTTKGEQEAETLLRRRGERDLFEAVVGDDDVRPVKPDPAPVVEACRRLGVAPEDAVMVGDTSFDVLAGRAAGCATVGVTWGHGSGPYGVDDADERVDEGAQLCALLLAGARNR